MAAVNTNPEGEYRDGVLGSTRGRGAHLNPANRFETTRLSVLGEFLDSERDEGITPRTNPTTVFHDRTRTVINKVESEDMPFSWTINPYRGCEHGCIYCYARQGHEYLSMSLGLDFETKIIAKPDAPRLLRAELADPSWKPQTIVMSGVTDPYQPVERKLRITRGCLEVMRECRQPVSLITKSRLILRDLDILSEMAAMNTAAAAISLTTLDPALAAKMEPRASSPRDRLHAMAKLASAGVPVVVMTAPMIPGVNDMELPALLKAAADHGATTAGYVILKLPYQNKDLFLEWLARTFPDRAAKVESLIRQTRGGELYDARWHIRMKGEGPVAEHIGRVFKVFRHRYGLDRPRRPLTSKHFRPPRTDEKGQFGLFSA